MNEDKFDRNIFPLIIRCLGMAGVLDRHFVRLFLLNLTSIHPFSTVLVQQPCGELTLVERERALLVGFQPIVGHIEAKSHPHL